MKKLLTPALLAFGLVTTTPARADLFGGDVAVLTQILVQAIQQLAQLRSILSTGQDTLGLMRDINRGINDSLNLMQTIAPRDPGIYREWARVQDALRGLEGIYGVVYPNSDSKIQKDADQSVAETVSFNNDLYKYTQEIDRIGETIKSVSHSVSPGGAQKLTAQATGVMLHVMNQQLRAQATGLKLQAQTLAIQNHREKATAHAFQRTSDELGQKLTKQDTTMKVPRF